MKTDTRQTIEIIGIFGVIASLVFVGMQLSLERKVAVAGQYQSRAEMRIQRPLTRIESPHYINLEASRWEKERPRWWNSDVESMLQESNESMQDFVLDTLNLSYYAIIVDNNIYQYDQGLMEDENWLAIRATLKRVIQDSPLRKAFISNQGSLPNLSRIVDEIILEIEQESSQ